MCINRADDSLVLARSGFVTFMHSGCEHIITFLYRSMIKTLNMTCIGYVHMLKYAIGAATDMQCSKVHI